MKLSPLLLLRLSLAILMLALCTGCAGLFGSPSSKSTSTISSKVPGHRVAQTAYSQRGKRYRLGCASPSSGFDCSGLVWWSYKKHGITIPRITTDQARIGCPVKRKDARPGDIIVFKTSGSPRGLHTGLYYGNNTFVHSPKPGATVRLENMNKDYWKRSLVSIRRVIR